MALLPLLPRAPRPGAGAPPPPLPLGPAAPGPARAVRLIGPAAAVVLLAAQGLSPAAVAAAAVPIALVGIALGVPHGAADHLVPFWTARRPARVRALSAVLAGYVAGVAVSLAAVRVAPVATLWVFLVVSAVHFGRGEVVVRAELAGRRPPGPLQDLPAALAHGAVTVAIPLALRPDASLALLDRVAPGVAATPAPLLDALAVAAYVLAAIGAIGLLRSGRRAEAAELALLVALFTAVPAPAAFGVYFGLWHAARHTLRLVALAGPGQEVAPGEPAGGGTWQLGLRRYLVAAAGPTVVAIALLGVLLTATTPTVLAAALVLLVGLTMPHLVVVADLDRRLAARTPSV